VKNRIKTIEVTKAYAKAFNAQDMVLLASMLDPAEVIFSRQTQNAILGKENVLRRMRNLFYRIEKQNKTLRMITAITDLGESMARPCLIGLIDGERVALCVLTCKISGLINSISILTSKDVVAKARATEKEKMD
jgi:hypothetical protein